MLTLWFPESPKYLVSVGREKEAVVVLGRVFSINTGSPPDQYLVHAIPRTAEDDRPVQNEDNSEFSLMISLKTMKDQTVAIFGLEYLRATILGCITKFCVYSSAYGLFLWVPDILNRMMIYKTANPNATEAICHGLSTQVETASSATCQSSVDSVVYVSSLVFGSTYCIGYTAVALLVNVIGERTLIGVLQISSGIAVFGIYWATDSITVAVLLIAYVLQPTLALAPLSAIIVDLYPTHIRNTALSAALSFGRFGASLTGFVIGSLFEYNCASTIFGLGMISIVSGLLTFLIPKPGKIIEPDQRFQLGTTSS